MSDNEEAALPAPTLTNHEPDDTIRIMLATDNHIGYLERDPIRGQDSINTFKEILQLARKHDVDMILLGGDLFHENRPSRDCLYQVMGLLREYTLGTKPVQLELLSSPDEGKPTSYNLPGINYEDENLNVAIPVFSIHGNHDDPQGAGPEGALCALDMLSVAGLVNYIGKLDLSLHSTPQGTHEGITVRPVLLRKGDTKLGLYGVGNVKDARMHYELRSNRVRMYMPRDKNEWFNLMVVHQNRVKHGPQEFVPEGLFDDNVDLVIWGHEHDCRIIPEPVAGKRYFISQPGSSVATSLAEGESKEKHVALLQIQGKEFQMTPLPLRSVRPFVMSEVSLYEVAEEENFDVADQDAISKYLKTRVNELIAQADDEWDARNAAATADGLPQLDRMLPLIRLKVDTTGVPGMTNPIRFGQEFSGRVANPRDVLVFHRAKQAAARRVAADAPIDVDDDDADMDPEDRKRAAERVRVHVLVQKHLRGQELQLLGEGGLADAIQKFVEKDDIHAIQTHVQQYLTGLMKGVKVHGEIPEEEVEDVLEKVRDERAKKYKEEEETGKKAAKKGKGKARAQESDAESADSMAMDVDFGGAGSEFAEDSEPVPPPKKTTRTTKAAATKKAAPAKKPAARGKKKAVSESEEEIELPPDEDDEEDDEPPPPKKRTNRAATLSQPAKKAPAKKAPAKKAGASGMQSQLAFAPTGARATRTAAGRSRKKTAEVIDLDDSDD
ncbi:unnamed protein product [Peniophora sp. CBMAI 1063]|nr:unnamed protein product [Peniophora sp. CBMAI 1063]